jgi:hypothetical protein
LVGKLTLSLKLREAFEEVGLDSTLPQFKLQFLTTLAPVVSRTFLFVVPCVYLLLSPSKEAIAALKPSPAEVQSIFACPLRWMNSIAPHEEAVYQFEDLHWVKKRPYRLHTLTHPSFSSKVYGMTYDALRLVAAVAYESDTVFTAAEQMTFPEIIEEVLSWEVASDKAT